VAQHGPRDDDDAPPFQPQGAGDGQAVGEDGDVISHRAQGGPGRTVHQGARGPHGQDVAAVVVLTLVDLAVDDVVRAPGSGRGAQPDFQELVRVVPVDLLGAGHRDRAGVAHRAQQPLQALGLGCAVIVEEPQPGVLGGGSRIHDRGVGAALGARDG